CLPPRGVPLTEDRTYSYPRFWDDGRQLLVCPAIVDDAHLRSESWSLPFGKGPDHVFKDLPPWYFEGCRPVGDRVGVVHANGEDNRVDVYDLRTGAFVYRDPPVSKRMKAFDSNDRPAELSSDSRSIVDRNERCVRDVA